MTEALVERAPVLCRLSALVYETRLKIQRGLDRDSLRLAQWFAHHDTEAALVEGEDFAALVFRGTEASAIHVRDLRSNIGLPVKWGGLGRAHGGYVTALGMVATSATLMAENVASELPLYVCGHSMGGALAELFAAQWYAIARDFKLAGVVTFGAPRSLNKAGAAPVACQRLRVVNAWDFAPRRPHIGLAHTCGATAIDSGGWRGIVSRHSIDRYCDVLDTWAEAA